MRVRADAASRASDQDYRELSELLFEEASMLDEGRFKDWLELLAEDVEYRLVSRTVSMMKSGARDKPAGVPVMYETFGSLKARVQQLSTPAYTFAENPASFTRRFVTNILIDSTTDGNLVRARSNVLVYRSRDTQVMANLFSISRNDRWRRVDGMLFLARRAAQLDEAVISARQIATLF